MSSGNSNTDWRKKAEAFLANDTGFRLGFLPSEARNPLTMHLDDDFRESTESGVTKPPLQKIIPEIKILALDNPPSSGGSSASSESSSSSGPIVTPIG